MENGNAIEVNKELVISALTLREIFNDQTPLFKY